MVSKTVICVFLLMVLAVSYAKPHHGISSEHRVQRQREGQQYLRGCANVDRQQNSDSDETDRAPCRLRDQDNEGQGQGQKKLLIQDLSRESNEEERRIRIITSQEETNKEKIFKQGPQHEAIHYVSHKVKDLEHRVKAIYNRQRSRGENNDESNEENNSRAERNQIHRP
ncbi:hypothetical protein CBL_01193 [Carabus blaptoides fortunei]